LIATIDQVPGVASSSTYVLSQGMLRSPTDFSAAGLRGIDPQRSQIQVPIKGGHALAGLLAEDSRNNAEAGIVLGQVLADKLKVGVGDRLMMMVVGTHQKDPRILPGMNRLRVVGLFETGMHQYDGAIGFMNLFRLQKMLDVHDAVTGIEVRVKDVDRVEGVAGDIKSRLGIYFWTAHWKQMHRNLFSMLGLQKLMMYVILTLIILVAAFNIASALIMTVREKVKDIAILKVMGASHRSIQTIFLSKGLVIGMTGILIGLAGGLALCWVLSTYPFIELPGDVYFLTTLPVRISYVDIALIVLGTLTICAFASLYPAMKAARIRPVDGIRYG
jgi:lipoprotein-releasing system permease protein